MSETKKFDLGERTNRFGKSIIAFSKQIPRNVITLPLIGQLVKAGTSVGANYCEADCAESRKDFEHKIGICKKEAKGTQYWLELIVSADPTLGEQAMPLLKEAEELRRIFITSVNTSRAHIPG